MNSSNSHVNLDTDLLNNNQLLNNIQLPNDEQLLNTTQLLNADQPQSINKNETNKTKQSTLVISKIPLALYIHIPWCVKKCPYCDFNSHQMNKQTDFAGYVDVLIKDAHSQISFTQGRKISSIFIGGGTPSLLPIPEYQRLFSALREMYDFADDIEVTMEANPASIEHAPFNEYLDVGINRLSIGVQTFNSERLETLGRIHDAEQAIVAVQAAKKAGFKRVNVDLMHGLPKQTTSEALYDVAQAIQAGATHISWYQLTIEADTVFYRTNPVLPVEDVLGDIEEQGGTMLKEHGFVNYEVSAWRGDADKPCRHNVNYWQFGDYLAIGAGAHGKISFDSFNAMDDGIYRFSNYELPRNYLKQQFDSDDISANKHNRDTWVKIADDDVTGEFMLDSLRLVDGVSIQYFVERTGKTAESIKESCQKLVTQGLLLDSETHIKTTALGWRYLNRVIESFI